MLALGLIGFAVVLAIAMIIVKALTNGSDRKRHAMAGNAGTAWMSDAGAYVPGIVPTAAAGTQVRPVAAVTVGVGATAAAAVAATDSPKALSCAVCNL